MTSIELLGEVTMIQQSVEPLITILIHNKDITEDHKKEFEHLWKLAKK